MCSVIKAKWGVYGSWEQNINMRRPSLKEGNKKQGKQRGGQQLCATNCSQNIGRRPKGQKQKKILYEDAENLKLQSKNS